MTGPLHMIFGGVFSLLLPRYCDYCKKKKKKKTSPENFGTKTKRLSEFSNEGTFLHSLELSMESIRVATTIPTKKPPNFRDERSSPKTSE